MDNISFHIIVIVILLIASGLFSAAETALLSFKSSDLQNAKDEDLHIALKYWLKHPNNILSSILIANNSVNILISSLTTNMIASYYTRDGAVLLSTTIVTLAILIFGEVTPKLIAKNYPIPVSKFVIKPISFFSKIAYPLVFILTQISKMVSKLFGFNILDKEISTVTEKDIRSLISVGGEEGVIEKEKREMLDSILDFSDLTVQDLVVPRQNVVMLQADAKISNILDKIIESGFSRIPVYRESFDDIIGAVYIKDLLKIPKDSELTLGDIVRTIYFVPDTKSAFSLLREFKDKKVHIAAVVDEYGGFVGVVTIEDILEQIVGDIQDEFDKIEIDIKKIEPNKFLIKGSLDIEEINEKAGLNIPENEDYDSLGGFISFITGHLPNRGDVIDWENLEIIIKEVDNHAVKYAIVTKMDSDSDEEVDIED